MRRHALRDLAKLGYTIGCHSHSHPDLTGLSKTELHREVHGSKQILEEVVGQRVTAFCYPYGAYDACVRNVVQAAGYDMAFTVDWGFDLGAIRVPVTLWQGHQDLMVPPARGQWLAKHVSGARVRMKAEHGHLSLYVASFGTLLDDLANLAQA